MGTANGLYRSLSKWYKLVNPSAAVKSAERRYSAKSEAMPRVLRLDSAALTPPVDVAGMPRRIA